MCSNGGRCVVGCVVIVMDIWLVHSNHGGYIVGCAVIVVEIWLVV